MNQNLHNISEILEKTQSTTLKRFVLFYAAYILLDKQEFYAEFSNSSENGVIIRYVDISGKFQCASIRYDMHNNTIVYVATKTNPDNTEIFEYTVGMDWKIVCESIDERITLFLRESVKNG